MSNSDLVLNLLKQNYNSISLVLIIKITLQNKIIILFNSYTLIFETNFKLIFSMQQNHNNNKMQSANVRKANKVRLFVIFYVLLI